MNLPSLESGSRVVVLSGAGLSVASGIPTFRDADGLWEGHEVSQVATPEAWFADRVLVRRFYDGRRLACAQVFPNEAHEALARLQHALGESRCTLITQNIDGLLSKAGAHDVIEMHGSLWRLRCEADPEHPAVGCFGAQRPERRCGLCGALLRPDVVWFGEIPYALDRIDAATRSATLFLSVGTSGLVYPAAGLVQLARSAGAHCIEINPSPAGGPFHQTLAAPAEQALPDLVARWLGEEWR